jgi:hypothetical protein
VRIVCEPVEIAVRHGESGIFSGVVDGADCGSAAFGDARVIR